ncbi:MAG: M23 family metallopeptidase [Acidobacteriota bacterium]
MFKRIGLLLLFGLALFLVWTWDATAPTVRWTDAPAVVGRKSRIAAEFSDAGRGLRSVQVACRQSDQRHLLLVEHYAGAGWPWQDRTSRRSLAISLESLPRGASLSEGNFLIEVTLTDQPNLWLFSRTTTVTREMRFDATPPSIEVLSGKHIIRQGGAESILYRVQESVEASGVRVGEHLFRGYPLHSRGEGVYVALFGLQYNQPVDTPLLVWAVDEAGNRGRTGFGAEVVPVRFRKRKIRVSDAFIEKTAGQILAHTDQVARKPSLLATFLEINGRLRRLNHEKIAELSRTSADHALWQRPFLQLSRSQVESAFADNRSYEYQGKVVDQQTHLGFDLASVAHSRVECANDGVVLWAGDLGIYGQAVVVDHGLGLLSLYGHLSSIGVRKGQTVRQGESLGRTGQTGLAGGDHLHFSLILGDIQVNPLEWWDPRWVQVHILSRLTGSEASSEKRLN